MYINCKPACLSGEVIVKMPLIPHIFLSVMLCLGLSAQAQTSQPIEASKPLMQAKLVVPNVYYVQGVSEMGSSANQNFISIEFQPHKFSATLNGFDLRAFKDS